MTVWGGFEGGGGWKWGGGGEREVCICVLQLFSLSIQGLKDE